MLSISNSAKKEYLVEIRKLYFISTKTDNTQILDELCTVFKFNRKYAIMVLAEKQTKHNKKKGGPNIMAALSSVSQKVLSE